MLTLGRTDASRALVLLPGFLSSPSAYSVLAADAAEVALVVVPRLAPSRLSLVTGRYAVEQEAIDAATLVRDLAGEGRSVVLGGHSRGGQAALRAARMLRDEPALAGLVLVDPVDGAGRRPSVRTATAFRTCLGVPTTVVGAGLGGHCAPEPVNHVAFADAVPDARYVVVRGLGHADVLDGRERSLGRRLCGGADDPDPGRALVAALLLAAVEGGSVDDLDDLLLTIVR